MSRRRLCADYTRAVLDGYGIEADPERMAYYRRLWIES
ncbi:aminoglycoside phosphotransferase [Microbacterium amylolyticum]|uniref:Aminoglycoside phosphotransferase n=1 Tax=Microbacterium amylolyticum TaxID=936337 RepID=A0ABS4ZGZ8_9MICO|nr:aminoglycoside phosphotransferase [Microbacterium amylolyticum]